MTDLVALFSEYKIVPVVVIENADQALILAELLVEEKLPLMEITFRSAAAAGAIVAVKKRIGGIAVGAGTLTGRDAIDAAIDAGSDFFVAPGFNPANVQYAALKGKCLIPGVSNPSLVEQAMELGLSLLKFFPAEDAGKTGMLKAFKSVYPDVSFMPTGGIDLSNIDPYLRLSNVVACGGSWLVNSSLIREAKWDAIRLLVREAVAHVKNGVLD